MAGHAHARIGGERGEHVVEAAQVHNDKRTALLIAVLGAVLGAGGNGRQGRANHRLVGQHRGQRPVGLLPSAHRPPDRGPHGRRDGAAARRPGAGGGGRGAGRTLAGRRAALGKRAGEGRRPPRAGRAGQSGGARARPRHGRAPPFRGGVGGVAGGDRGRVGLHHHHPLATPLLAAGGALVGAVGVGFGALAYFAPEALHGASAHAAARH